MKSRATSPELTNRPKVHSADIYNRCKARYKGSPLASAVMSRI
jgi:hypothetical protein